MTAAMILTFVVLAIAVYLFVTEKWPVDVVAMLVLGSVIALGLVTPREALSGFSSEATITVAAMFVLSAAISRSGVLIGFGELLGKIRWGWLFALVMMALAASTSAFINNTAVVAVFLPLVIAAATATKQPPSRMLIPLSYAAQFGGVCTLVGTSTNLLVHSVAQQSGLPGFTLFEFTQLGLWFVGAGILYIMLTRRWLLPDNGYPDDSVEQHGGRYLSELFVGEKSAVIGKRASEALPLDAGDVVILEVLRDRALLPNMRGEPLQAGDRLLVRGAWPAIDKARRKLGMSFDPVSADLVADPQAERVHGEVLVLPGSPAIGRTLADLRFGHIHRMRVHGLQRPGSALRGQVSRTPLAVGDTLLVDATPQALEALQAEPGLLLVRHRAQPRIDTMRALLSVAIMAGVIGVSAIGWLPIVASAILGCVLLVILHCLKPEQAYAGIDWRVIMLLAGVLPLGIALEKSGGAQWLADAAMRVIGTDNPLVTLAIVYGLTSIMTELMSNNAAAVLIAPIAIAAAEALGVDSKPFLVAVAFAASTSFSTPIGYQTNTMVYTAGGYRFADFLRMGIPLNVVFFVMAIALIPRYFPF
ncbi:SLC13 family permease [Thermomonas brevis]